MPRSPTDRDLPRGRPFVLINMAMTADGKIATANRAVSSFGSRRDARHLYELRATADAVMSGARTVDSASVDLGPGAARFRRLRLRRGLAEFNLRIVVSGTGSVDPRARVFSERFSPLIVLATRAASPRRVESLQRAGAEVRRFGTTQVDLARALRWLRRHRNVRRLLCEGGGELNAALLRAGLVDELHLTVCPVIAGGRTAPSISDGPDPHRLADAIPMELVSVRRVGQELFLVYRALRRRVGRAHVERPGRSASRARIQSRSLNRFR